MRSLVKLLSEKYQDSNKDFKPIHDSSHSMETHNTVYNIDTTQHKPNLYHSDHNDTTHTVAWDAKDSDSSTSDKLRTIADAKNLHHHALQNKFKPGDVVKSIPAHDNPKLKKLYRRAGFGATSKNWNAMVAIVRKHSEDHPEESMRGKNYLEPLHHDDINNHRQK